MAAAADFSKMVPGFDFLQGLMKGAGSALPSMGQWVAPTLDPEELNKRINDLRTVQFWLEQNARMIGTTIQALEVQRMTLSTLKSMNLPVADLGEAFKLKPAAAAPAPAPWPAPKAAPEPEPEAFEDDEEDEDEAEDEEPPPRPSVASKARAARAGSRAKTAGGEAQPGAAAGLVDPMQWWGALTQQFTEIAAQAVKDSGAQVARSAAGAVGQQAAAAAGGALKAASGLPAKAMKQAAKKVRPTAPSPAAKRRR
ncbi:MAG: hypothetical protein JNJ71_08410 [Rubrivivax sp.]|nr:hypothetical protein [Rubrivivax sp.]